MKEIKPKSPTYGYSSIISAKDYSDIISNQHLYISDSDMYIKDVINSQAESLGLEKIEIVELGCGPGRVLQNIKGIDNANLTGIDIDNDFLDYARQNIKNADILYASALDYVHHSPVDIFYSQGFHHHVDKNKKTAAYLSNIYKQLKSNGLYIVGDEFIPEYNGEKERAIKLVIWYSHIINHAMSNNFTYLAQEEAKTLLDDLQEGNVDKGFKTNKQIDLTLSLVSKIDQAAVSGNMSEATNLAVEYLSQVEKLFAVDKSLDISMDLSRKDYKISHSIFVKEVEEVGFKVKDYKSFGPIDNIGAMTVYILEK
jgi:SAM-dependent methyltransferase